MLGTEQQQTNNANLHDDNNYATDSDIEDPKYTPSNVLGKKEASQPQPKQPQSDSSNSAPNFSDVFQDKMKLIQEEKELHTKLLRETENEKQKLLTEISSLTEWLKAKDCMIAEFQAMVVSYKQKFLKLDKDNSDCQRENESLVAKLAQCEALLRQQEDQLSKAEEVRRNVLLYKQQLKDMEHSYSEKEKKLLLKCKEKESEMRNEHEEDVSKVKREKELLQQENEKLKHDAVLLKSSMNSLITEHEDKQFKSSVELSKLKRENKKLAEQFEDAQTALSAYEQQVASMKSQTDSALDNMERTNKELTEELYHKDEYIKELQDSLSALSQSVNSLTQEDKQSKLNISNKEQIIAQLKKQLKQYEETIQSKEQSIAELEQANQTAYSNYCDHLSKLAAEKEALSKDNEELRSNLELTTSQYKNLQEKFQAKFSSLNKAYIAESSKHKSKETHYNELIRQLKLKEKQIANENRSLKDMLKTKDRERMNLEHELRSQEMHIHNNNHTSYYHRPTELSCSTGYLNSTYDKIVMNKNILSRNNALKVTAHSDSEYSIAI